MRKVVVSADDDGADRFIIKSFKSTLEICVGFCLSVV